jgi:glyoxylase-like metal-dependent hydrolase (beta-lactamase superfamily II)
MGFWTTNPSLAELRVPEQLKDGLRAMASWNLKGIKDQVELVENEVEVSPGIRLIPAPGHAPGQLAVMVSSEDTQLLHLSDTVLHPLQVEHPDWWSAVDFDVEKVVATRQRLLAEAAEERALVFAMHFEPFPSLGYVIREGSRWQWQQAELSV